MIVMTWTGAAVESVSYALVRREERTFWARHWRYILTRAEGSGCEVVVSGRGPGVRAAIGFYLQDVRALGGPDAPAAAAAIRAGWFTQVSR